jgi:maleate cis-trans isomerase
MSFTSWRGKVGCIKPTMRTGGIEELIRMLPEGIGILPLFLNISKGTTDEFKRAVTPYEPLVKTLVEAGCDLIHPEGAPPFMLLGYKGEAAHLKKWEREYKVPFFTSGSNHVRALRALKAKKIVGATYFVGPINDMFAGYFKQAGFDVLGMEGLKVDFDKVQTLSPEQVYAFVKQAFLKHRKADAIYLLGTGWRVLPMVDLLEQDLGVPVVHPVPARCWEIQLRLSVREPVKGYGRLLAEMVEG